MAAIKFAVDPAGNNTPPLNGNTVPATGTQGLATHAEALAYFALAYENIYNADNINFGGITGTLPVARNNIVETDKGQKFIEVIAYIPLNSDYAAFPDGKKLWKQVTDRLPNDAAATSFNY